MWDCLIECMSLHCILFLHCLGSLAGIIFLRNGPHFLYTQKNRFYTSLKKNRVKGLEKPPLLQKEVSFKVALIGVVWTALSYHTLNFLEILRLNDGTSTHEVRHGDVAEQGSTRESAVQFKNLTKLYTHLEPICFVLCFGEPAKKREPFAIKARMGLFGFQVYNYHHFCALSSWSLLISVQVFKKHLIHQILLCQSHVFDTWKPMRSLTFLC